MEDCEQVDVTLPIRQGDVLKHLHSDGHSVLKIVVTADCDIANGKFGDAGLACVQLMPLVDYMLDDHARTTAHRQLKKRFERATEWINLRWLKKDPQNVALTEECVRTWVMTSPPEEIEAELALPVEGNKSFIMREIPVIRAAQTLLDAPVDRYSAIDALRGIQSKSVSRSEQVKTLFGSLDPRDLPLDVFYVSSVPGEPGVGFIAKLRALSFIPFNHSFTSMVAAKEVENSFVRVGRLAPTFRHALAQQFGMLFARIGMPKEYETDRDAAFTLIADQITADLGEEQ